MRSTRSTDRLESSLLDRLTDPGGSADGGGHGGRAFPVGSSDRVHQRRGNVQRVNRLRQQIEQNLLSLLTTRNLEQSVDLTAWPAIKQSVLNFGLPDLTGATASGVDLAQIAKRIKRVVERYEPRFHAGSVRCRCRHGDSPNEIAIEIDGLFGPDDDLQTFAISSVICLSSGQVLRRLAA